MTGITSSQLINAEFTLPNVNPVLRPFHGSVVAADPSVLTPGSSHDGKWHMFFHTTFGVFCSDSDDGISFYNTRKVTSRAMRPDINYIGGKYYLFYEKTRPLVMNGLNILGLAEWRSEIYCRESVDLRAFGKEYPVIRHTVEFEKSEKGVSISNPFLINDNGKYRMWYSCGLTFIKDCGFCEPTYINYAESGSISSGYVSNPSPVLSPDKENPYMNLCCGCIKVYRLTDCYAALQNGIYEKDGKSHSAVILLLSENGTDFTHSKVLIEPGMFENAGWMNQFVYASCLAVYGNEIRIYFNARDTSDMIRGRECIGFVSAGI